MCFHFNNISIIAMKQNKPKSHRNPIIQLFKEKCKEILKQDPKNYLCTSFKQNQFLLDITPFTPEDMPFFQIITSLPLQKIVIFTPDPANQKSPGRSKSKENDPMALKIKSFPQTTKFRQFLSLISQTMESSTHLRIVRFERVPFSIRAIKELKQGIQKTKSLRELGFSGCSLAQEHLQQIKGSLSQNKSLITLDLGGNQLCDIGGMIGHILCEHSRRRNQVVFFLNIRGEMPAQDLSNSGICEINLESNKLNDKSAIDLSTSLKGDSWTKCLNLRHNNIRSQGVRQIALMLKNNTSLISLDMRGNQGLSKEYSRYIYKKLVLNMEKYKQQKELFQKSKERKMDRSHVSRRLTPAKEVQGPEAGDSDVKYKSVRQNFYGRFDSKQYTTIAQPALQQDKNNMTLDRKIFKVVKGDKQKVECPNCKTKTFQMLRLQKKTLDLELQLRKVKHALLTNNIDISAILPQASNQSILEHLSNKSQQNDDELLQRMEQIMMELTRVIETIQEHQNTKVNISNPLDNPNSFSNTLQLYDKNSGLQQLGEEIDEEERLRAVFQNSQRRVSDSGHS